MIKNFKTAEILESVDLLLTGELKKTKDPKVVIQVDDPIAEKIVLDAEKSLENKNLKKKIDEVLVLKDEIEDEENDLKKATYIKKGYTKDKFERKFIPSNDDLKSKNRKLEEKIKDLNILIESFSSKNKYTVLNKSLKLYQEDNAALRKKIFDLNDKENSLRLKLAELALNKKISKKD